MHALHLNFDTTVFYKFRLSIERKNKTRGGGGQIFCCMGETTKKSCSGRRNKIDFQLKTSFWVSDRCYGYTSLYTLVYLKKVPSNRTHNCLCNVRHMNGISRFPKQSTNYWYIAFFMFYRFWIHHFPKS